MEPRKGESATVEFLFPKYCVYEQYDIVLPKNNGLRLFQDHPNAGRYLEKFLYLYISTGYPVKAGNPNTLQWSPFNIYYEA